LNPQKIRDAHRGDRWVRGAFTLTLVIFAAIGISAFQGMSSYLADTRSVAVSNDLNKQLDYIVSSLKDIQRGVRGYVVTGDTSFLTPFLQGTPNVRHGLEELRRIASSSAEETGELDSIYLMSERFIATTDQTIIFMQDGKPGSARMIMRGGETNRVMDRIDAFAHAMTEKESRRVAVRSSDAESKLNASLLILLLGTAFNLTLIIGMFVFMNRQLRRGREVTDTLTASEQQLETVINSVQEGITFCNAGGRFEVFNQRMAEITGYTMEEANRSEDFFRLIYPDHDDRQKALDGAKVVMAQQGAHVSETTITAKSGVEKVLRVSFQILGQNGRKMFLTTYDDITEKSRLEQALRESEHKLRLIFENAQDGINIFEETVDHEKRRLVECNPRYAELAGRSREELLAAGITSGMTVSLSGLNVESIKGGNAFTGSFSWIRPDGKDNIIEYTAMPIEMRGKKYTIGIDRDVTSARMAENLVHASQIRYQQLFEASPNPLMVYDAETLEFLEVNQATVKHYGYSPAEFLAMSVKDIHPPEDVPRFLATVGAGVQMEERTGTWRHRKKDGTVIQVRIKSHAFDWKGRRAWLVLAHDITDLLQIEEELRVQKTHFERLFESAPEGIALLDNNGNALDVNSAFARLFGISKEKLIGHDVVAMIISSESKDEVRTALKAVMNGANVRLESLRLNRGGQPIDVSLIAVPVDSGGGTNMAYILCQDITLKKRGDREKEVLIRQLQKALAEVKTLGGLLPICAWCKKIRDDQGYYHQIETFIANHSAAKFTHGICPDCREKFDRDAGARGEAKKIHEVTG
jgi:PAS domain S-box-containing protein